jgi:hypothetical protein
MIAAEHRSAWVVQRQEAPPRGQLEAQLEAVRVDIPTTDVHRAAGKITRWRLSPNDAAVRSEGFPKRPTQDSKRARYV